MLQIHGFTQDAIAYCEAKGIGKCFIAYAESVGDEYICEVGFNPNSGYTYIALENGISICSMLGRDVEYLVTNLYNGEEFFYDSYDDAVDKLENMNEDEDEDEDEN